MRLDAIRASIRSLNRSELLLVSVALVAGVALRLVFPGDIEFKGDEAYNFAIAQEAGRSRDWPWLGMASGVGVPNPGWSVWVFVLISRLLGVSSPPGLAMGVALVNVAALLVLLFIALRSELKEREPWLWAFALACVSPIDVLLHRKIWAPSIFPLLALLLVLSWWRRGRFWPAFAWGAIGATLGQIQMGGFFYALAFVLATLALGRKSIRETSWLGWLAGSVIGALPMIPWLYHLFQKPELLGTSSAYLEVYRQWALAHHPLTGRLEVLPLQFWWVWLTSAFGLGLDYSLQGEIWKFLGNPLVAAAHWALAGLAVAGLAGALRAVIRGRPRLDRGMVTFLAVFAGFGILLTLSPFFIHRHYLIIAFPFLAYGVARLFLASGAWGRRGLLAVFICQLLISASFLAYIHANGGAPSGDYGVAYQRQGRSP